MTLRLRPEGVWTPPNTNLVVGKKGVPVYLSGQVSRFPDGTTYGVGDFKSQAEKVWDQIRTLVTSIGATMDDIVRVTTYITDAANRDTLAAVKRQHFSPGCYPASSTVQVTALMNPEWLLEVDIVVVVDELPSVKGA